MAVLTYFVNWMQAEIHSGYATGGLGGYPTWEAAAQALLTFQAGVPMRLISKRRETLAQHYHRWGCN